MESIYKTISAAVRKLKEKFWGQVDANAPEFFPNEDIQKWKKAIKNNHGRVNMEGEGVPKDLCFKDGKPLGPDE